MGDIDAMRELLTNIGPGLVPGQVQEPYRSYHGLSFRKVLDPATNFPDGDLCCVQVEVDPFAHAAPHMHPDTDVIIDIRQCGPRGAVTMYGPDLEHMFTHELGSPPFAIKKGVPHFVINPGGGLDSRVVALEYRRGSVENGNVLLPELNKRAAAMYDTIMWYFRQLGTGDKWQSQ
jgi:uncharacterized RmlC-like cupin family protein